MSTQDEQLLLTATAHIIRKLQGLGRGDAKSEELAKRLEEAGDASERRGWNIEVAAVVVEHLR